LEIVPGVHKVDGAFGCNVYLLVDEELTLVDTGLPRSDGAILSYIRDLGRNPAELMRIVLTHGHPDHTSAVDRLRRRTGARVLVHSGDVRRDGDGQLWIHYISQPFAFQRDVPFFHRVPADEVLEDGSVIPVMGGLSVLHTPGHTPGSICLHLKEHGVLFTGDTLLSHHTGFSRPMPLPGYDADRYWDSLSRLSELEFDVACGGHGTPVRGQASRRLRETMAAGAMDSYLHNLRHRFLALVGLRQGLPL